MAHDFGPALRQVARSYRTSCWPIVYFPRSRSWPPQLTPKVCSIPTPVRRECTLPQPNRDLDGRNRRPVAPRRGVRGRRTVAGTADAGRRVLVLTLGASWTALCDNGLNESSPRPLARNPRPVPSSWNASTRAAASARNSAAGPRPPPAARGVKPLPLLIAARASIASRSPLYPSPSARCMCDFCKH